MSNSAYIRPCAAFPDGYEIPWDIVPDLVERGLIVQDYWSENTAPDNYAAVYTEDNLDEVAYEISEALHDWIAPFRKG